MQPPNINENSNKSKSTIVNDGPSSTVALKNIRKSPVRLKKALSL
jgi:hypothetical protein